MYGYHDVYYGKKHEGFRNSIWIELIGFDNTLPDYGVGDFLEKMIAFSMRKVHQVSLKF